MRENIRLDVLVRIARVSALFLASFQYWRCCQAFSSSSSRQYTLSSAGNGWVPQLPTDITRSITLHQTSGSKRRTASLIPHVREYRGTQIRRIFALSRLTDDYSNLMDNDDLLNDDDDDDDDLLSYLPLADEDWDVPPLARQLLYRATLHYVHAPGSDLTDDPIQLNDVLSVIQQEHDSTDVPVKVSNATFDISSSGNELGRSVAQVLSFAALYGVPKEIVRVLLGPVNQDEGEESAVATCQSVFATQGWSAVSFPKGIGIRVKRNLVKLYGERFSLPRWPWQRRRSKLITLAQHLVEDASFAQPPRKRLMSKKEFIKALSAELNKSAVPVIPNDNRVKGLAFFPTHKMGILQRIRRSLAKQAQLMRTAEMLKTAGRAGTLSYGFLNFAFYASGIVFQWRRLHIGYVGGGGMASSLSKLGRVFGTVYLASQVTKLPRMLLALAMAPFGDKALHLTRNKLRVSENTAFFILTATLLGIFFAVLTAIVVGDMASRKLLVVAVV